MNFIKYISTVLILVLFAPIVQGQTITKTASKSSVYIGEEFTYTIAIENINDYGDVIRVEDVFGPEVTILGVSQSSGMQSLTGWGICSSITDSQTVDPATGTTTLEVLFNNCSGSPFLSNRIYIDVRVEFNNQACGLTDYTNTATLFYTDSSGAVATYQSDVTTTFKTDNPVVLHKELFKSDANTLYYDVRVSPLNGNLSYIDLPTAHFEDEFTLPSCLVLSATPIEVVYIPNESTRAEVAIPHNINIVGSSIKVDWNMPATVTNSQSSLLFSVKINYDDCTCASPTLLDLMNTVTLDYSDICGNPTSLKDDAVKLEVSCDEIENNGIPGAGGSGSGIVSNPCKINFSKTHSFPGNNLGLTMKGCEGKYYITITNCSDNLEYKEIKITDPFPSEVDILGINTNGWNFNDVGGTFYFYGAGLGIGQSHTIEIGFKVNTNLPNHTITNCADIEVQAYDINTGAQTTLTKRSCTSFKTVPNQVTLVSRKQICSDGSANCSLNPYSSPNSFLPGDEVEYELFFFNYGNKDGYDIKIEDVIPAHLKIIDPTTDVKVYKQQSGSTSALNTCDLSGYTDITNDSRINYSYTTQKLEIQIDDNLHKLDAFTCDGVSFYKVSVKGKIQNTARSGTYPNKFIVDYKDPNLARRVTKTSNQVTYTVNIDNLVFTDKKYTLKSPNCENNTTTVDYEVYVINAGNIPINVDIDDVISVPTNVSIVGGINNLQYCVQNGPSGMCTYQAVVASGTGASFNNFSQTTNSFRLIQETIQPCSKLSIKYSVTYNTSLLTSDELVKACNNYKVNAYTGTKPRIIEWDVIDVVLTSNPIFIRSYVDANSSEEQLNITRQIKMQKANPEQFNKDYPTKKTLYRSFSTPISIDWLNPWVFRGVDFGTENIRRCVDLKDCLSGKGNACILDNATGEVELEITGVNNTTGEINTRLNINPSRKVNRIEYILTDVEYNKFCGLTNNRIPNLSCVECDGNVTGNFKPLNTSGIGSLAYLTLPYPQYVALQDTYKQWNVAIYEGNANTFNSPIIKDFKFPNTKNCSGNFEFTITAMVYFEDCCACYASDAIDFRRLYNPFGTPIDVDFDRDIDAISFPFGN